MMPGLQGTRQTSDVGLPSFTWDAFCDILDGRSSESPVPLPAWLTASNQYFFAGHPEKQAVEVLCIQLSLSCALCTLVAEEHEHHRCSRGVTGPEHVVVRFPERHATILPIRWSATVSLEVGDQEKHPSLEKMPVEMSSNLTTMPVSTNFAYVAPQVKDWPMGTTMSVTALVQSADPIPDDDQTHVRGLIRVHVIADGLQGNDFSDRDVFRVSLPGNERLGSSVEFWARKVESPERGIMVSGMTETMSPDSWTRVTSAVGTVCSSAEIAVYRAASPAHDVYSCGILLLRALLGTEERRWEQACEQLSSIVYGLEPIVQGLDNDHYSIHVRVREWLREAADCFEASNLPEGIWWDALVAVLRACSSIQGFSYAREATGYDPSPARLLARDLELLVRRARIELFEADERDAIMLRLCDRAIDRLGAGA